MKAVVFDMDDTLLNREGCSYDLYREIILEFSGNRDPFEIESIIQDCLIWDQYGNVNKKYVQKKLLSKYHINLPLGLDVYWDQNLWKHSYLFAGVEKLLANLKKKYKIAILTNGKSYGQNLKIKNLGLDKYCDAVVVSGDYQIKKPNPKIFEITAEKLDVEINKCYYVGDTFSKDIYGAYLSGMKPIWIQSHGYRKTNVDVMIIKNINELEKMIEE